LQRAVEGGEDDDPARQARLYQLNNKEHRSEKYDRPQARELQQAAPFQPDRFDRIRRAEQQTGRCKRGDRPAVDSPRKMYRENDGQ
jgi:hypothetical protein